MPSSTHMRAVVATGYGSTDVLKLTTMPRPEPDARSLCVRVLATNVSAADSMMRRGDPAYARLFLGVRRPKAAVPGTGFAGVVSAVGDAVTEFAVGDAVFGEAGVAFGAHAEFVCVPSDGIVLRKPQEISFSDAAALCDGPLTSLNFLARMAEVQPGQRVLINGASGSLGTAAVQLAKAMGAEVTGVCSAKNAALVRELGADEVIDYSADDFTARRDTYDVIYDTVGKRSFRACEPALRAGGTYLSPVLSLGLLLQMAWTAVVGSKRARFDATGLRPAGELREMLADIARRMVAGQLRLITDRTYRLDQIAAAHAYVDTNRKRGNVIVSLA